MHTASVDHDAKDIRAACGASLFYLIGTYGGSLPLVWGGPPFTWPTLEPGLLNALAYALLASLAVLLSLYRWCGITLLILIILNRTVRCLKGTIHD
jgi:hypothetical protein